jgi:hypothetical protein
VTREPTVAGPDELGASPAPGAQRFRIRPRFRWFAWGLIAVGALYGASPWLLGTAQARGLAVGLGAAGILLGGLYLLSPAWRMVIVVDDGGLELLTARGDRRFRLPWSEVARVIASPATRTCFVDGGDPARSLIVPGRGAPAPYAVDRAAALYDAILAQVPRDRVQEVELVSTSGPGGPAPPASTL